MQSSGQEKQSKRQIETNSAEKVTGHERAKKTLGKEKGCQALSLKMRK